MGTAIKHPMPDQVQPLFVIFLTSRHSDTQLYSCGNGGQQRVNGTLWSLYKWFKKSHAHCIKPHCSLCM